MPLLMASFTMRRCSSSSIVLNKKTQIDNSARPVCSAIHLLSAQEDVPQYDRIVMKFIARGEH
jgi:hypothetical protein